MIFKMSGITTAFALLLQVLFSTQALGQPMPVRNEVAQEGREVLMLRHAFLQKGSYGVWYQASRDGVWPWYEKIGSRIVGDWQVIYPQGVDPYPENDQAWRLARYASYEHWQATRDPQSGSADTAGGNTSLGGNGPDQQLQREALRTRGQVQTGSLGGIFLQGYMAETRPLYMPGLNENFVPGSQVDAANQVIAVRNEVVQAGEPILALTYHKIRKGGFEEFHRLTRVQIWPYLEKIGVRPVGEWQVVYMPESAVSESPEFDEIYTLLRFASFAHWQAVQTPVQLGGNGPDYLALRNAEEIQSGMISGGTVQGGTNQESTVQFLAGDLFHSPPLFMPATGEIFQPAN